MKIKKQMAIMSHLSDVQHEIQYQGLEEKARMRINFVKMLVCDGNNNDYEYTENELNEIWEECNELYGIPEEN